MEKNSKKLQAANPKLIVQNYRSLIGKSISSAVLSGKSGTKSAQQSTARNAIQSETLDRVLLDIEVKSLSLIKVDVDGYDWDVIDSGMASIEAVSPIIFFEYFIGDIHQKQGYQATMINLKSLGYDNFAIFDNYGQFIVRTTDLYIVLQLGEYLWRQNQPVSARTFYYFDLLLWKSRSDDIVDAALEDYKLK